MRASLECDKKQAIEKIVSKLEFEKQKSIEETKQKQWVCVITLAVCFVGSNIKIYFRMLFLIFSNAMCCF